MHPVCLTSPQEPVNCLVLQCQALPGCSRQSKEVYLIDNVFFFSTWKYRGGSLLENDTWLRKMRKKTKSLNISVSGMSVGIWYVVFVLFEK